MKKKAFSAGSGSAFGYHVALVPEVMATSTHSDARSLAATALSTGTAYVYGNSELFSTTSSDRATFTTTTGSGYFAAAAGVLARDGTRMLALELETDYGGEWVDASRLSLSGNAAATALLAGEIDAAAFAASIEASYVDRLLRSDEVRLMRFDRAPALARRHEALSDIVLLRGVVDIGLNVPAEDVPLVAPVAQLVVRKDLHPAIESLLMDAAMAIHSEGTLLAAGGRYPDPDVTDLPITDQARRYYQDGPSFLRRYFSFDVANFLERAWILAIPLLTLLFPLVRVAPPIYRWRVRRKIYVWYADLRELEDRGRAAESQETCNRVLDDLENLQAEIGAVEVPLSYTDDLYRLRSHVEFVKQLVRGRNPVTVAG